MESVVSADFAKVNELIKSSLGTDVALINHLANYIIMGGGKRLRPRLALLSAKAAGYAGAKHISVAAIIEFIHTATLLHDDVVDESAKRRGRTTANEVFGNQAAVLTGDFLYSRSFQMMVTIDSMDVMQNLADTTNVIAEGEVMQLMNTNDPAITRQQYFEVIYRKTARLFESACELGAILGEQTYQVALRNFGKHLGNAFQLVDDALDYDSDNDNIGKNHGDDLAEGKITLPLIYALKVASEQQAEKIKDAIINARIDQMAQIVQIIKDTGAIDYTLEQAGQQVDMAIENLQVLPASEYRDELVAIALGSVRRKV